MFFSCNNFAFKALVTLLDIMLAIPAKDNKETRFSVQESKAIKNRVHYKKCQNLQIVGLLSQSRNPMPITLQKIAKSVIAQVKKPK